MNVETQTDALRHHTKPVPANCTSQTRADITPRSLLIAQSTSRQVSDFGLTRSQASSRLHE